MTTPQAARQDRPSLTMLVAVSMVNPLALNIFVPSMPGMEAAFGTTYARVQLALSLYLAAAAVAQLVHGPLSDRFGRRPVMLAGLVAFIIGTTICRFAPSIEVLIAGRMIQGAGGCAGLVLSRAIVRDLYGRDQSASILGFVTMGMAVAPSISPVIGGVLDEHFGWTASFDLLLAAGLAVTVGAVFRLPETNHQKSIVGPGELLASFATLARVPLFRAFCITSVICSCTFFAYVGGAPYVAQKIMGIGPSETGLWFMSVAAGYVFGNFLSGRYSVRFGILRMMTAGNVIAAVACSIAPLLVGLGFLHPAAIFLPAIFLGLGNGIALPSTIAGAVSVRPDLAGAASGLVGSLQVGAGAVATVVVGSLLDTTAWPLVMTMMTLAITAMLLGLWARALSR